MGVTTGIERDMQAARALGALNGLYGASAVTAAFAYGAADEYLMTTEREDMDARSELKMARNALESICKDFQALRNYMTENAVSSYQREWVARTGDSILDAEMSGRKEGHR